MAEIEKKSKSGSGGKQEIDYPLIMLGVLLVVVGTLIYIGYDYLRDDAPLTTAAIADAPIAASEEELDRGMENPPVEKTSAIKTTSAKKTEKKSTISEKPATKSEESKPSPTTDKAKPAVPTKKEAVPAGGKSITHAVKAGETFSSIARRYNLTNAALKSLNPQIKDEAKDLKSNVTQLKVQVKAVHTVGPGDVLSKVAAKYGVSKSLIMAANGKTKDHATRGESLIIPFP
jgi:LysM repeat protein